MTAKQFEEKIGITSQAMNVHEFAEAYHKASLEGFKNPYNQKKQYTEWAAVENALDIMIRKINQ